MSRLPVPSLRQRVRTRHSRWSMKLTRRGRWRQASQPDYLSGAEQSLHFKWQSRPKASDSRHLPAHSRPRLLRLPHRQRRKLHFRHHHSQQFLHSPLNPSAARLHPRRRRLPHLAIGKNLRQRQLRRLLLSRLRQLRIPLLRKYHRPLVWLLRQPLKCPLQLYQRMVHNQIHFLSASLNSGPYSVWTGR